VVPVRRGFPAELPSGEAETSFSVLWCEMAEDGFVEGDRAEKEELQALYPEVRATLDRLEARVTPDAVFDAVEEAVRGLPLSPERHAQVLYTAEWYAREAFPGRRGPGGFSRSGRRPSRRDQLIGMFRCDDVEEVPQDPALFAVFPSPEEAESALRLAVPPIKVHVVYGAVAGLYRTFGTPPDFPTLVERLRQDPGVFHAGYAPVWYVWRTLTDLHLLIRDRMQEVLDAAGR